MKRSIKALAFIASLFSVFSLGSCNTGEGSNEDIYIGIMLYNYTDDQGKNIKSYCDYLAENLPVTFEYQTIGTADDDAVEGCEALISKGVDAIITGYDSAFQTCLQRCTDAGVYYNIGLYQAEPENYEGMDTTYMLGGNLQFKGGAASIGEQYAEIVHNAGLKHIGCITFPVFSFVEGSEIYNAFKAKMAELDPEAEVYDIQQFMFTQELCEQEVVKLATDHPEVDCILGLGSGLDYILPAMKAHNVNAKLVSLGYNDTVPSEMSSGTLLATGTNNHAASIAGSVARIINAVDGNSYADQGDEVNLDIYYPVMTNEEEVNDYNEYINPRGEWEHGPVTAEELKDVIIRYNADATWADLKELVGRDMETVKSLRS